MGLGDFNAEKQRSRVAEESDFIGGRCWYEEYTIIIIFGIILFGESLVDYWLLGCFTLCDKKSQECRAVG